MNSVSGLSSHASSYYNQTQKNTQAAATQPGATPTTTSTPATPNTAPATPTGSSGPLGLSTDQKQIATTLYLGQTAKTNAAIYVAAAQSANPNNDSNGVTIQNNQYSPLNINVTPPTPANGLPATYQSGDLLNTKA